MCEIQFVLKQVSGLMERVSAVQKQLLQSRGRPGSCGGERLGSG